MRTDYHINIIGALYATTELEKDTIAALIIKKKLKVVGKFIVFTDEI